MYPFHPYPPPHHNQYPYHHYPNREESISPHINVDPSKPPSAFEFWPQNNCFGHPNPHEPHGCFNHSYPSGYYSVRPPYPPHTQPPPQLYYHGPYAPHPDAYPNYFVPPSNYSVDQARYHPDKTREHCCGCPNHTCYPKGCSSLKIEEADEPKSNDASSSLIRWPNYPNVWIPPSYAKEKGSDKISDSHSGLCNRWVPMGMRQGGEKKNWHGEDGEMQFPWPVVWMPGYERPEGPVKGLKEVNSGAKSAEELPPKFKIIPLKLLEDENRGDKPGDVEDGPRNKAPPEMVAEKERRAKIIPVKQADETNEMKPCMIEKQKEKGDEKKSIVPDSSRVKKTPESKPTLPKKSSKLPPVCLRVDPLPKKKKSMNGTSCFPSPPLRKEETTRQDNKAQVTAIHDENPKEIRAVVIDDKLSKQDVVPIVSSKNTLGLDVVGNAGADAVEKASKDVDKQIVEEEGNPTEEGEVVKGKDENENEKKETEGRKERRRVLPESDAALIIQSAYRGWEVRRWKPLEKLRKIARVRQQAVDVKRQIEGLEASSKQPETKERLLISETIMNLLLQLDTIQGLHPSVREIRKSVARELTCLQDKLDCLGSQAAGGNYLVDLEENPSDKASGDESPAPVEPAPGIFPVQLTGEDGVAMHPSSVAEEEIDGQALEAMPEHSSETEQIVEVVPELDEPSDKYQEGGSNQEEKLPVPSLEEATNSQEGAAVVKSEEKLDCLGNQATGANDLANAEENPSDKTSGDEYPSPVERASESCPVQPTGKDGVSDAEEISDTQALEAMPEYSSETEPNGEAVSEPEKPKAGNNQEEKAEGPEPYADTEELVGHSTGEDESVFGGKTILLQNGRAEFEVLPLVEDNSHGDNNGRSVEEAEGFDSEAPLASTMTDADHTDLKDVGDAPVQFDDSKPVPTIESAPVLKEDDPDHPADITPVSIVSSSGENKLVEENEKLRVMLERLIEAGKQQLGVISDLNGRVKDLEKKIVQKRRAKIKRSKPRRAPPCHDSILSP